MSDIHQWLDDLGLGQYADAFEANKIGLDLLARLNDDALEKLGVEAMGDRIRLMDAIAARAGDDQPPESQTAPETATTIPAIAVRFWEKTFNGLGDELVTVT